MITIDFIITKDESKYISIINGVDSKNKNNIKISIDNPTDWNKQNINAFLIRLAAISGDNIEEPILTDAAQKAIDNEKCGKTIKFIHELFAGFVKRYNESK
ncbi:hypothetical protein [Mycoplasma elephantis]|uniref:hypothetical protein n=1 Tax=Mycoplasma elephantis TaxID=114882 RepID=UPI00048958C5|nr:hypothetical protein [Mycoplasma elephantis]